MKTLAEFLTMAHTHGLSDPELEILGKLVRAAAEWAEGMPETTHGANNHNGALCRATNDAIAMFGTIDGPRDPHRFCNWKCVASKQHARCEKAQPTTICLACGIEFPTVLRACWSCRKEII